MTNTPQTSQRDKYVKVGMVAFFVLAGILLLFFFLFKISSVKSAFITLTEILQPIILGIVVAYLVNPIMQTIDKPFSTFFVKVCRFKKRGAKIARGFSVALAIILFLGLIAAIVYLITPQFIESAVSMIETLPAQIDIAIKHITDFVGKNELLSAVATNALDYGKDWLENDLPEFVTSYAGKVATGVVKTAGFLSDLIIGFIVAVYVLMSKETFKAQFKKMLYAFAGQKPSQKEQRSFQRLHNRKNNRFYHYRYSLLYRNIPSQYSLCRPRFNNRRRHQHHPLLWSFHRCYPKLALNPYCRPS